MNDQPDLPGPTSELWTVYLSHEVAESLINRLSVDEAADPLVAEDVREAYKLGLLGPAATAELAADAGRLAAPQAETAASPAKPKAAKELVKTLGARAAKLLSPAARAITPFVAGEISLGVMPRGSDSLQSLLHEFEQRLRQSTATKTFVFVPGASRGESDVKEEVIRVKLVSEADLMTLRDILIEQMQACGMSFTLSLDEHSRTVEIRPTDDEHAVAKKIRKRIKPIAKQ